MSQRQFLPLDEDSRECEQEFDLTNMSAIDYLKQVRFERKKIPQVVTVHPLVVECSAPTIESVQEKSDCETFNPNKPTREWREIQKDKFSEIQNRIIEIRNDGKTNSRLTTSKAIEVDSSDSCLTFCQENDPKLSAILTLDQRQLEELIEILSSYLSDIVTAPKHLSDFATFSWLTKWIYSALACLRLPLEPEVHNCIRMIAKSCVQVTNHLKTLPDISSDSFLHWNLIVVVIATNFSQFDLLSL